MEQNKKKSGKGIFIFLVIVIFAIGGAYSYWHQVGQYFEKSDNAYVNANQSYVTSQVSGAVREIGVQETQKVQQGELLVVLDDLDYRIAMQRARLNLIKVLSDYSSSLINFEKKKKDFLKDEKAYKYGIISQVAYENSKFNYETAKAQFLYNSSFKENLQEYPAVAQAIVAYKEAGINLSRTKIYAPISGVVAKKNLTLGQKIQSGQVLFTIIDLDDIWIDANLKETQVGKIKVGNSVKIESDLNGKEYEGFISGISGGSGSSLSLLPAQNATGNWIKIVQRVPVKIAIKKESIKRNGTLPIGTSTKISIDKTKSIKVEGNVVQNSSLNHFDEEEMNREIEELIAKVR